MLAKPGIYLFSLTLLMNSIKHDHSCKIIYVFILENILGQLEKKEIYHFKNCTRKILKLLHFTRIYFQMA